MNRAKQRRQRDRSNAQALIISAHFCSITASLKAQLYAQESSIWGIPTTRPAGDAHTLTLAAFDAMVEDFGRRYPPGSERERLFMQDWGNPLESGSFAK